MVYIGAVMIRVFNNNIRESSLLIKSETNCKSLLFIAFTLFTYILFLFISCDVEADNKLHDVTFNIVDSLYVDGVYDLEFLDKDSDHKSFLFYSLSQKLIYLLNRESKEFIKIPFPGISTSVSGYSFKSGRFYPKDSEDSIIIWTNMGYHFYDSKGKLVRNEKFKTLSYHPNTVFFDAVKKNSQLIAIQSHAGSYSSNGVFSKEESNLIQTYNFGNSEMKLYKGFIDDNPRLSGELSGDFNRKITIEGDKFFHILLSPDNQISTFSIHDEFQLINNERINIPDYIPPDSPRYNSQDHVIQPDIYWLFSDAQYFYIVYKPYIDPGDVNINFSNSGVLEPSFYKLVKLFLFKYNRLSGDGYSIELPKNLLGFQAKMEENLFLVQPGSYYVEHKMGNVFYIVSIEENI